MAMLLDRVRIAMERGSLIESRTLATAWNRVLVLDI